MLEYRIRFVVLVIAVVSSASWSASAQTWQLDKGKIWKDVPDERKDQLLPALAEANRLVNAGETKAAQQAFDTVRKNFPEIAGPDLDLFIKAEMFYCKGKLAKTVRSHDKLLAEHARSAFRDAALERQFAIATSFLAGKTKMVLGIIRMKRYAEGIAIMEKITDRTGFDTQMGIDASVAVAKNYEERKMLNEAYLKWWEISLHRETGAIGRDALLGMARNKHAAYNKHPEHKRSLYDASSLSTAQSSYERFRLLFPEEAARIGVDKILADIYEQLAYKQLSIARYYQKVGNRQAANLYYDMVTRDWALSKAAETAREMLAGNHDFTNKPQTPSEK